MGHVYMLGGMVFFEFRHAASSGFLFKSFRFYVAWKLEAKLHREHREASQRRRSARLSSFETWLTNLCHLSIAARFSFPRVQVGSTTHATTRPLAPTFVKLSFSLLISPIASQPKQT